jgi:hypothetical protein
MCPLQVYAASGIAAVYVTWKFTRGIASTFVDVCGMAAQCGFLVSQ